MLLKAIERNCPIFSQTLLAKVFPIYSELAKDGFDFEQIFAGRSGTSLYERLTADAKLAALKTALQKWAAVFNADSAGWLLDAALHTMRGWYGIPERRNSLSWDLPLGRVITLIPAVAFEVPGWQVQDITFTEYREVVNRQLADYEKKMRMTAESRGLVLAKRQYSPANFEWFVLYQFAGQSSTKIAVECSSHLGKGIDESTVLKGVKAVADLIGWNELRRKTRNRKTQ